ncbi:MAG: L-glutamate gamma-semialdehyde dehydrogenase [Alphaproteobacteria bacterium]
MIIGDFNQHFFSKYWKILDETYRQDEEKAVAFLLKHLTLTDEQCVHIEDKARQTIVAVRKLKLKSLSLENFLKTYALNSEEGLALMCLAEALLRIPDTATQTALIHDKVGGASWAKNIGRSDSFVVNLASSGLAVMDKLLRWPITRKVSEPMIRKSVAHAMKVLGNQFVLGETIEGALARAKTYAAAGYCFSYDMLGEAALTKEDATRYFLAYTKAIQALDASSSISVKLSALHPRYEVGKRGRVLEELVPRVLELAKLAKAKHVGLTIDAEESERLILSLEVFAAVYKNTELDGWEGLGLAVQSYQKRSPHVIDLIAELAQTTGRKIPVRLVKGAYWDAEIKRTQEFGLKNYAVYTRKAYTDISYLICAQKMFEASDFIYPQFASHNAYTLAAVEELAKGRPYELQRLHGMGDALFEHLLTKPSAPPCRIYAPVGVYQDLLAYLIRRLLENGASTSFVNQLLDPTISIEHLIENPITVANSVQTVAHPQIPHPKDILQPQRQNSLGIDFSDYSELARINAKNNVSAKPVSPNPADIDTAEGAFAAWSQTSVVARNQILHRLADLLESHAVELMQILAEEGGKTINDAMSEFREAVDFCRYYGNLAEQMMQSSTTLPGPTGELNQLSLHARGIFVCISPWNFPLAIFLGQVVAALATGNVVLAKHASQTPRIASRVVELAYEAGIPGAALQLLFVEGAYVSQYILSDPRIAGIAFTGSTSTARQINQALANKPGPIVPLIAETGGLNAMIVDSSALFEQVVRDVIASAFQSAGQRCSALRLLFIQEDVADGLLRMLAGAMAELRIGNPEDITTDVGPVIDKQAQALLELYCEEIAPKAKLIYRCPLPDDLIGDFVAPQAWEIEHSNLLDREVFGPILHVVRYKSTELMSVIEQINAKGYGLTMGVHSRIDAVIQMVRRHARVGNLYINRNIIGAVVGVQPFGGEGLSGTGPKAGGPHYLTRFVVERTFTQNTTATGGNTALLMLGE